MAKKVTIHDIAREAGVSAATVSYIINNRTDKSISEETKKKVWQIVNLFNYKPSAFAKNLRSSPDSRLIAVYTGNSDGSLYKSDLSYFIDNLHKTFPIGKLSIVLPGLPYRRLDNVDAIVAYNIDEASFLEIGNLNFVPLIAVDCIVSDTLYFKISCDFEKLKRQAEETFGKDYYFVSLYPASDKIRDEILSTFDNVRFVENMSDLREICTLPNVLTTSKVVQEFLENSSVKVLFAENLATDKCTCLLSCLEKVLQRTPFDVHDYKV